MSHAANQGPDRRAIDAHRSAEDQCSGRESRIRSEFGQTVGPPAPLGDEDFAENHRGGDGDLPRTHDADQVDVQVALVAFEAGHCQRGNLGSEDEQRHDRRADRDQGGGQDRPGKLASCLLSLVPEPHKERQERPDHTAEHEDRDRERDKAHGRDQRVRFRSGTKDVAQHLAGEEPRACIHHEQGAEDHRSSWEAGLDQVREAGGAASAASGCFVAVEGRLGRTDPAGEAATRRLIFPWQMRSLRVGSAAQWPRSGAILGFSGRTRASPCCARRRPGRGAAGRARSVQTEFSLHTYTRSLAMSSLERFRS